MTRRWIASSFGALAVIAATAGASMAADSQIRPFIGSTFHGDTTFVDLENGAQSNHLVVGVSWARVGEIFGVDAELADAPGFFQAGDTHLVVSSRVTTITGNLVIAAPRRLTEYVLRPYLVAGGGLMRVRIDDSFDLLPVSRVLPAFDVGGGVMAFLTNRVGASFEMRRFQNLYRPTEEHGLTFGNERLSFWRATAGVVFRY